MQRIVLKITGDVIRNRASQCPFDAKAISFIADEIVKVYQKAELAIILGGGNIVRGRHLTEQLGTTPYVADHIGMLATIMNVLLLQDFLEKKISTPARSPLCALTPLPSHTSFAVPSATLRKAASYS